LKVRTAADHVLFNQKSFLSDRQIAVECRKKANKDIDNVTSISNNLHESVLEVAIAHNKMVINLKDDSIDIKDIKAFAVKLKELKPVLKAVLGSGIKVHL